MQAKILQILFQHRYRKLVRDRSKAILSQEYLIKEMIDLAGLTEFGKTYHFGKIQTIEEFKRYVPIQEYEDIYPFIERMLQGEKDILWYGKTKMFAKSSGTSNAKSKFIPLSKASLKENHFRGGKDILSIFSHVFPNINLFEGKNISIAGSFVKNKGLEIGDLSALLVSGLPSWVQQRRLPSKKIALLADWEKKIELVCKETVSQDVVSLSGVPSWNLVLLKEVLQRSGKKHLREVWPKFKLYMHGGVNFQPYKDAFQKLIGVDSFVFLETYNASEGFFAIQDTWKEKENGMLLLCNHGVFYEFLELKDANNPKAKTLQLDQVALDRNYVLIVSTKSGLWRYKIGDTIRFVSLDPFRIVVTGRLRYFINLVGEELIECNTNSALLAVCKQLNCRISEYSVAPIFPAEGGQGGHEWFIEFEQKPQSIQLFSTLLDQELKKINSDYEAKRTADLVLQMPKINILPSGVFYKWLKSKGKIGSQNKVPRLQNHRKTAEEIIPIWKEAESLL